MYSAKTIGHVFIYFNCALSEIIFSDFPSFHGGMPFDTVGWLYSLSTDFLCYFLSIHTFDCGFRLCKMKI